MFCLRRAYFLLVSLSGLGQMAAQAQDLCSGLVTDKVARPMTALAKPAVGQAVTDPQFGTTIRRISAAPSGGTIKPMYSTISAWNADESKMVLYRVGQGHQLYDGKTYQFIQNLDVNPADLEQIYWHTSDPDIFFYVDGNRFIRYHVSTGAKDTLTTFSFCSSASGGSDPMYISWDSKRIGLGCGSERFIYDISTNTVIGRKTLTGGVPQIAPSGTLAFLDGKVVDTSLNTLRTLALGNPEEHASLGQLANGHDTYNGIAFDGSPTGTIVTFDLTDGTARTIVGPATGYPYPPTGTHVSAVVYKQPGWVTASIVGDPAGQGVLDNEIVLADTNPGGKVCRVAHHRSWGGEGSVGYWAEPHAVPSPSGTRILFGSDWGNSGTVDAFVVELPSYIVKPEVKVTRPNGGESWPEGSLQTVQWTAAALTSAANVRLSITDGSTVATIASVGSGQRSYNWTVPDTQGSSWKITVCSEVGGACEAADTSDAAFSISAPATPPSRFDENGDDIADLLWHHQVTGDLYAWFMRDTAAASASYLTPSRFADTAWQIRGVADLNADGKNDVLWHNQATGDLYVWFLNGTVTVGGGYLSPSRFADTRWQIRAVADLNADGRDDILWHHQATGDLYVWFMDRLVVTGGAYLTPNRFADTRWQIRAVADFNADGRSDILWHHQITGDLYVWFLNGTVTTGGGYLTPSRLADTNWRIAEVADFNGDRRSDVLWHHQRTGDLYVWFLNGTVTTGGSYLTPRRFADPNWQVVPR